MAQMTAAVEIPGFPRPPGANLAPLGPVESMEGDRDEAGLVVGAPNTSKEDPDRSIIPLPEAPETEIELRGGVVHEGRLLKRAQVRELNGADEEALSRVSVVTNPVRFIDTVVHRCLITVGGVELTAEQIDAMLIGDRDTIVLAVRRATYGDSLRLESLTCPNCQYVFSVDYSLTKDVEIRELDDAMTRVRTIKLTGAHKEAEIVLIDGAVQKSVFSDTNPGVDNAGELNTALLRKCVQRIDGVPVMDTRQVREDLSVPNRKKIIDYLAEHQPGPRYGEVKQTCPNCAVKNPLPLGLSELFREL